MGPLTARRLVLPPGELADLCARIGAQLPPGFEAAPRRASTSGLVVDGKVRPSVAAGLAATCSPQLGVVMSSTLGGIAGALGIRDDLGGSMLRADGSDVEVSAWPALRLGDELARSVPALPTGDRPSLHCPLSQIPESGELRAAVVGTLRTTVVSPPDIVGQLIWLATTAGWLALEPAEVHDGVRWATVRPVEPADLGAAVAPFVAAALA